MTGPNLLAWAKELMDPLASPNVANLFSLARAILADEEERKRITSIQKVRLGDQEYTPQEVWVAWLDMASRQCFGEPEPPSE